MSKQDYLISGIVWRKKDGNLPTKVIISIPGYVYLDTPANWWGPWIRQELSEHFGGKVKRYDSCSYIEEDCPLADISAR